MCVFVVVGDLVLVLLNTAHFALLTVADGASSPVLAVRMHSCIKISAANPHWWMISIVTLKILVLGGTHLNKFRFTAVRDNVLGG